LVNNLNLNQMKTTNLTILRVMNILFWLAFIGLCIKTGAILISFAVSLFINSEGAKDLYLGLNLFDLYSYNKLYYISTVSLIAAITGLKAFVAYLMISNISKRT
jgi:hypothetical protein